MASLSQMAAAPDLTEQVYQRLLYAICDGEPAPSARLTQEDLAATLGVSRQPVLQALRLLKMVELLGEDKLVWASDFPHIDAEYGVVAELMEHIARLPESAQRKILGENAAKIYCLPM
jgi:DNA-binding transcriptional MocR family regulator